MGDTLRRVLCGPSKARKPAVRSTVVALPEKPLQAPPNASAAPSCATRDRCSCGRTYGTGADVWHEFRGGHLRAVCGGCA